MTVLPPKETVIPDPRQSGALVPAGPGLTLEIVDTEAGLAALRPAWEALEQRDLEGTVFLSWAWLAEAFHANPSRWRVFAVYRTGHSNDCVCIFPIKYRVHWSKTRQEFQSEIEAGGRLIWSEYTGFLCDSDWQGPAIDLIAEKLRQMPWSRLSLRYEATGHRAERFMAAFPSDSYSAHWKEYRISKGQTNNLACPQVALPKDYETYLTTCLSTNTRQKFRRFTRRQIDSGDLHVTHANADSFGQDLTALLEFWCAKWAFSKGSDTATRVASNYRQILETAQRQGLLYMPVLWQGDTALGALGHILDPRMKRVHFIVAGRDEASLVPNIGLLLHSHAIRWAIDQGYETYDFCHGDEAYKYSFGARDKHVSYFSIRPLSQGAPGAAFDPISHTDAMRRLIGFIDAARTQDSAHAARQLLSVQEGATARF